MLSADSLDASHCQNSQKMTSDTFDMTQSYCLGQGAFDETQHMSHQMPGQSMDTGLHKNITIRSKQTHRTRIMSDNHADGHTSNHSKALSNPVSPMDGSNSWQSSFARRALSKTSITGEENIVQPRPLPEKIDFKHLEKFEG